MKFNEKDSEHKDFMNNCVLISGYEGHINAVWGGYLYGEPTVLRGFFADGAELETPTEDEIKTLEKVLR